MSLRGKEVSPELDPQLHERLQMSRRRGRPLGALTQRVLSFALSAGRIDSVTVARSLQLSRADAARAVFALRAAGYLVAVGAELKAPARRPVIVCEPSGQAALPALCDLDWHRH